MTRSMDELIREMDSRVVDTRNADGIRNKRNLPEDFGRKWRDKYRGCI